MSYINSIESLNYLSDVTNCFKAPRKCASSHYYNELFISYSHNLEINSVSSKECEKYINTLKQEFPNINPKVFEYQSINQQETPAGSFVGFLNLLLITNNNDLLNNNFNTKTKIIKSWRSQWDSFNIDYCSNIAESLDKILLLVKSSDELVEKLTYVPIRSLGYRETKYNTRFWIKDINLLLEKYNISIEVYNSVPMLYQHAYYIESILDKQHYILINACEHSRVCIGYNETELIFIDSCDINYEQTNIETGNYYKAGFSRINKWIIYTWMRDMCYFS